MRTHWWKAVGSGGKQRASVAPQAAASASLPHGGSTAGTESHVRVQGCGGHGRNTLVAFPKEPTWREGRESQCLQITLRTAYDDKSKCIIHSLSHDPDRTMCKGLARA